MPGEDTRLAHLPQAARPLQAPSSAPRRPSRCGRWLGAGRSRTKRLSTIPSALWSPQHTNISKCKPGNACTGAGKSIKNNRKKSTLGVPTDRASHAVCMCLRGCALGAQGSTQMYWRRGKGMVSARGGDGAHTRVLRSGSFHMLVRPRIQAQSSPVLRHKGRGVSWR